ALRLAGAQRPVRRGVPPPRPGRRLTRRETALHESPLARSGVVEILMPEGAVVDGIWSEQERRRVTRLCAVRSGDPAAAEDLAQETLLEAWRIRHRLVDPSGGRPWLDAIARNVCRRWHVRRGRIRGHELSSERPEEQPGAAWAGRDELADVLEKEEL